MTDAVPVLVTGGEGMLGSALAEEAARYPRLSVRAPGKAELDVRDPRALERWTDWVRGG